MSGIMESKKHAMMVRRCYNHHADGYKIRDLFSIHRHINEST